MGGGADKATHSRNVFCLNTATDATRKVPAGLRLPPFLTSTTGMSWRSISIRALVSVYPIESWLPSLS